MAYELPLMRWAILADSAYGGLHPFERPPPEPVAPRPARRAPRHPPMPGRPHPRGRPLQGASRPRLRQRLQRRRRRPAARHRHAGRQSRRDDLPARAPVRPLDPRGDAAGGQSVARQPGGQDRELRHLQPAAPVNSRPGARLSEHGRANAVDIGAFVLADGRRITVLEGWNGSDEDVRRFLRASTQPAAGASASSSAPMPTPSTATIFISTWDSGPYCR